MARCGYPGRHRPAVAPQDLTGRDHHVWLRRAALVMIAACRLLGLLNVFGQHAVSGGPTRARRRRC